MAMYQGTCVEGGNGRNPADRLELALSLVKLLKDLLVECRGEVVLTERAVTGLWLYLDLIETELSRALSGVEG